MSFAERNPVVLGLITALLIVAGSVGALAVQGGLFRGGYELTAQFADAAGLAVGDHVLIAGVRAGDVRDLRLAGGHVEAVLRVADHDLPSTTRAKIVLRTLVGRRAVELVPTEDWQRLLAAGDVIPLERTDVLIDVPEFGEVSEELFSQTDTGALNTFLGSLTEITRGQRLQVATLVQGGSRLAGIVSDQEQEVRELIRRLRTLSEALASRDRQLATIVDDFGFTVGELAERREELRRLLRATSQASATVADLVADERASLDTLLSNVHIAADVVSRHQLHIAEALAYAGDAIQGFASIAYAGPVPVPWGNVMTTSLGSVGVDVIAGCGGLIDRRLDDIIGPDPRSCAEQENDTFPDDQRGEEPEGPVARAPARLPLDSLALRALGAGPLATTAGDGLAWHRLGEQVRR